MLKKLIKIVNFVFFLIFIFSITNFYFSERNIILTNKSRSVYAAEENNDVLNLPLLENDTQDAIEYTDDVEIYKKNKKKYKFFELIKNK